MEPINVALESAKQAGQMIISHMYEDMRIEQKGTVYDVVTEMDRKSENLITSNINWYFSQDEILGEENHNQFQLLNSRKLRESNVWIIDPIDGTTNYTQKLPGYSISIAMVQAGELALGVVYDPMLDEMFCAEKGKGTFVNGQRVKVSDKRKLQECVLGTGFPTIQGSRKRVVEHINNLAYTSRNIRSYGSAALQMAYTAAGRLDAFWEEGLNVWDVAAGELMVREAGGAYLRY